MVVIAENAAFTGQGTVENTHTANLAATGIMRFGCCCACRGPVWGPAEQGFAQYVVLASP